MPNYPKVTKVQLEHWTEEDACGFCGCPVMYPEDPGFVIENMEHLLFCSRGCAYDYLHNADWEPAEA